MVRETARPLLADARARKQAGVSLSRRELTVYTTDDAVTLEANDLVWLAGNERHWIENIGDERAVGLDAFAPGRSFDFWLDQEEEE